VETVEKPKSGFPTVSTIAWKTPREKRSGFPTVSTTAATSCRFLALMMNQGERKKRDQMS
jgi:hypothetical protein